MMHSETPKAIGFFGSPAKAGIKKYLPEWVAWLVENGLTVALHQELAGSTGIRAARAVRLVPDNHTLAEKADLVVSLGGDGTILLAAHYVVEYDVPILGVKFGGLGFLADVSPADFHDAFLEVIEKRAVRQERLVLSARRLPAAGPAAPPFYALNDFVVARRHGTKATRVGLWMNDAHVSGFIADGLIVATPTGSTAYSMAAGGPLVFPTANVLIITPIAPHSLTTRPIVVSENAQICIEPDVAEFQELVVTADGRNVCTLKRGEKLQIETAGQKITLLQRAGHHFFHVLKTKLSWGEDIRRSENGE